MSTKIEILKSIKEKYLFIKKVFFVGYCGKRPFIGVALMVSLAFIWAIFCLSYVAMTAHYTALSSLKHGVFVFRGVEFVHARHNGGWYINLSDSDGKQHSFHTYLSKKTAKDFPVHQGQKVTVYFKKEYMTFFPPLKIPLRESVIAVSQNKEFVINYHKSREYVRSSRQLYLKLFVFSISIFMVIFSHMYRTGKENLKRRGLS